MLYFYVVVVVLSVGVFTQLTYCPYFTANLFNGSVATQDDLSSIGKHQPKRITFHEEQLPDIEREGVSAFHF